MLHGFVGAAIEEIYSHRLVKHYEILAHHYVEGQDLLMIKVGNVVNSRSVCSISATRSAGTLWNRTLGGEGWKYELDCDKSAK